MLGTVLHAGASSWQLQSSHKRSQDARVVIQALCCFQSFSGALALLKRSNRIAVLALVMADLSSAWQRLCVTFPALTAGLPQQLPACAVPSSNMSLQWCAVVAPIMCSGCKHINSCHPQEVATTMAYVL
jgi:hypothetical protein